MRRRISTPRSRFVTFAVVCGVLTAAMLLTAAGLTVGIRGLKKPLKHENAASFFAAGDLPYQQFSLYLRGDQPMTDDGMRMAESLLEKKQTVAGLTAPEHARLYLDCASCEGTATVSTPETALSVRSAGVTVTATAGDFFLLHPMTFVSGAPYSDGDLNNDRVVLDVNAAWRVYGASDVAGMTVVIGGREFLIAGVVEAPSDAQYGSVPRVYMPYASCAEVCYDLPEGYTVYEALLPDPIADFAADAFREAVASPDGETVCNSERFALSRLLAARKGWYARSVRDSGIVYPWWENAALVARDRCVPLAVGCTASLVVAGLSVFLLLCGTVFWSSRRWQEWRKRRGR